MGRAGLDSPPLAHSLVRLVNDAAQLKLLAALARLARDRARVTFHLLGHGQRRWPGEGGGGRACGQATPTPTPRTREPRPPDGQWMPRTFESLQDTQAVFLLMRDCGEDCSAAEARRSSDSRDSPLDIVGEGFGQSTLLGVPCCRGEGDVAEALPTIFAGSALRADWVGRGCLSQSQTT